MERSQAIQVSGRGLGVRFDILTIFPEMFGEILGSSMLRIAQEKGLVEFHVHNFRDFSIDRHRRVDDRPFGGGPGMVLRPEPITLCLEALLGEDREAWPPIVFMTPQGDTYNQQQANELSSFERLVLVCGHYEGFDERLIEDLATHEVSVGDYVLTGGELPALVLLDSVVRLLPGVLGDADSIRFESFTDGILDHPHYTRPVEFRGRAVPEVLRSGDHAAIEKWRREASLERTKKRRPDLLNGGGDGDE